MIDTKKLKEAEKMIEDYAFDELLARERCGVRIEDRYAFLFQCAVRKAAVEIVITRSLNNDEIEDLLSHHAS